ncbi:UDP-N-acetylmuramoyl-L-alanine--D-glutamate ligase [Rubritalea spongiae]|uniref:UDP-N-acetylmuramoylalanine--D-glutamate ligase n=1 Tax=Rubritalea spongiae TaxID=430797 RepID=A0ABW5E5B7_9BACT
MILEGKNVVVLGAGRSGRAAACLALSKGAEVRLFDANPKATFDGLDERISVFAGATEDIGSSTKSDLLVISPGIDTYGSFVKAFVANAGELIGETELAARYFGGKIVGITGTNGKTTTTELVERILNHSGTSCVACGNYGVPFSEVLMMENVPESVALELSSFQLETVSQLHVDAAIWLNFSADHMDRYSSLEDYFRAKLNIFLNQTEEDTAVVRAGEELGELAAQCLSFASEGREADYHLDGDVIMFRGERIFGLSNTRMRGLHNAENVMAAVAATHSLSVSYAQAEEALLGFAPPLHRCELIRTLDGVEYLNDSKATNLHALDSALRSQTRPVVLIAGGKEKGLVYDELLERLEEKVHSAIVYGEIGAALELLFSKVVPTACVNSLDEAVALSQQYAHAGDVVLLSPGTSSFDQFSGYEARGDHFRELVLALK